MDEDRLGTQCVIKQFSPQVQGEKSFEKAITLFNQEAVRLHELGEHQQIPTLLAYFEQDGYLYLVQQFVEGQNLLQEMKASGVFNERKIRDVLADILPVLRFIHNHQVIHRDITPMNILRRKSDNRLILIDFGIAKQLNETTPGEIGTRIGTEGYAPMEQFRGGRAYPASDLYSLGATCLHLMTAAKPDSLYDPLEGRWIWRDYLEQQKGVLVSDQFAYMIDTMLKDLVNDRYQSADEVMRDLNADYFIPKPKQVGAPPGNPPPPSSPPPMRPPTTGSRQGTRQQPTSGTPSSRPPTSQQPSSRPPTSRPPTSRPAGSKPVATPGSGRCIYTLTGHTSWVTAVAIAPNGVALVSGSLDETIKIWNLPKADLLKTLPGHRRGVNALAISPSGQVLVSVGDDCALKLWNLTNGALLKTLTGHARDVNTVTISPDGQFIASGSEDRTIRLWQATTGQLLKTILGAGSIIRCLAISPDNRMLVSGGFDNNIKLWSMQTGEQVATLSGHLSTVNAVLFSPDNQTLLSASKDKTVKIWSFPDGRLLHTLQDHTRDVNALAMTPDGHTLITASSDTTIKIWDLPSRRVIDTISDHTDNVTTLAISPDGKVLVSGSSDKTIKVWRL
jgi:WD40 repeat protein